MTTTVRTSGTTRTAAAVVLTVGLLLTGCTADPAPAPLPAPGTPVATGTAATVPPPASTPVAAPTPGTTTATVPSRKTVRRKPVALDADGEAADGVLVRLSTVEAIKATAQGPGEVAGPAITFTVSVQNTTDQPVDLGSAVVNVTAADTTPASQMTGEPASPLQGSVAAGSTATGVYVFTLAKDQRDPVTVEVTVSPADALVVFRGRAAS